MAFDGEEKLEHNRARRDRDNWIEKAPILDEQKVRFRSEVKSYVDLVDIYFALKEETEEDKKKKKKVFKPYRNAILGEKRKFQDWLELRDRARKDLFWLGRDVLKKDLVERTHQPVCDLFMKKNFDGVYHEDYTLGEVHRAIGRQERSDNDGNPTREMLLLDSRGHFKSTIDGIDCVQWLINVPDIRILILTGEYKLAVAFMSEIKGYFYLPEGGDPTDFHILFPEFVLRGVAGTSKEPIECPARKHAQKEPSIWVNSIDSNLSGWHCDGKKGDDIVTDENSNNEASRAKLKEKYDGTENLVDEWGFSDHIGTRYFVDDWYGTRLEPEEETDFVPLKYFCRKCWMVKPGFEDIPLKELTEEMVDLTFPEKADFKSLRRKLLKNERQFRNQQLNEPLESDSDAFKITFSEDILRNHMYHSSVAPKVGDLYICWDWAPSANKYSDMSVGVCGRIVESSKDDEGIKYGIVILEIVFDRWKPSELAYQIVSFDKKWHPKKTLVEKSPGAELLQMEVQRQAMKYGVSLDIYWKLPSLESNAKRNRIKGVETLLSNDRLWFVSGSWIDETIRQLVNYTGEKKNKGRKDDIPDAISFLTFFLPSTEPNVDMVKMQELQRQVADLKKNYERIFGGPAVSKEPPPAPSKPDDPRNRIFGGNGIHV